MTHHMTKLPLEFEKRNHTEIQIIGHMTKSTSTKLDGHNSSTLTWNKLAFTYPTEEKLQTARITPTPSNHACIFGFE